MSRYIDADALKAKKTYSHERHEYIVPVAEIDWLPTVDAVPVVHGEWIFDGKFMELHRFHCSKCMRTEFRMSDYCPNCGARMDGERKDGAV